MATGSSRAIAGRPKCGVWKYFSFCEETNKCTCLIDVSVEGEEEKICQKTFKGKYPTNMKKHLKSCHPKYYKVLESEEIAKKIATSHSIPENQSMLKQSKLLDCLENKKYDPKSKKYEALTQRLALFIGATSVPLSLVDNEEFRELLTELDPRYQVPHRQKLGKEIEKIYLELRNKLSVSMRDARKLSLCADVWSKQGMTASFLGITCHYFNHTDMKCHSITLAVKRFPSPHTATRVLEVFESVIEDWKLSVSKIFRVLTDNGSNMLAAFRNEDEDGNVDIEDISGMIDIVEEDDIPDGDDNPDDEAVIMETDQQDTSASSRRAIEEFEGLEAEHQSAFRKYRRVSCFIHTLQLVVKVFEVNPSYSAALKKARGIVSKVNKSTKATEKLTSKANKKLISDCKTRWDSTYLMLERLLHVKVHLVAVLDELVWDSLTATQWKNLEVIQELLQPFAHHTNIASTEHSTSIGMVCPLIKELTIHLEEMAAQHAGVSMVANKMLSDLKRRFQFITNPESPDFDPLYVTATFLTVPYRKILESPQRLQAEMFLTSEMKKVSDILDCDDVHSEENNDLIDLNTTVIEPPRKRFKHLSRVSTLLEEKESSDDTRASARKSAEELEIENYSNYKPNKDDLQSDPFSFWMNQKNVYPNLALVACDILATPASTAPVERIFLVAGQASKGIRNRLGDHNLEREVFLRKNKKYLINN